jgi:hypothetical protein
MATSAASVAAAGGCVIIVPAMHWRWGAVMPTKVTVRPPAHQGHLALEQELASPSVFRSW